MKDTLLKKHGNKIKFKKEAGLLGWDNFQSIEIITEYSALTHKNIMNQCLRKNVKEGESGFDQNQFMLATISHCVEFDGKKLDQMTLFKLEKSFMLELYSLLTEEDSDNLSEVETSEK